MNAADLLLHGGDHARRGVADVDHRDAGAEVDERVAVDVDDRRRRRPARRRPAGWCPPRRRRRPRAGPSAPRERGPGTSVTSRRSCTGADVAGEQVGHGGSSSGGGRSRPSLGGAGPGRYCPDRRSEASGCPLRHRSASGQEPPCRSPSADLLAQSAARPAPADRERRSTGRCRWVHVSELADPPRSWRAASCCSPPAWPCSDGTAAGRYVRRLADAGVAGAGLRHRSRPRAGACPSWWPPAEDAGLPLLEVPRRTPFIAISRGGVGGARRRRVRRGRPHGRRAAGAHPGRAGTAGPGRRCMERLARLVGGWALLLDAAGTPLEAAPGGARPGGRGAAARAGPAARHRGPRQRRAERPEETVLVQSLGTGPRTRGFLAVGRPGPLPPAERHVVNAAALLLTLRIEQSRGLDSAMAALRAALLRLLLAGEDRRWPRWSTRSVSSCPPSRSWCSSCWAAGERAPRRSTWRPTPGRHAGRRCSPRSSTTPWSCSPPRRRRWPPSWGRCPQRVRGAAVGSSRPVRWSSWPTASGRRGRRPSTPAAGRPASSSFADLAAPGLAAVLDPAATQAFADSLLAPLVAADRAGTGDLVHSLRVWLAHHGQWEPAAAQLGIHRHTLRKRVHRAGGAARP